MRTMEVKIRKRIDSSAGVTEPFPNNKLHKNSNGTNRSQ